MKFINTLAFIFVVSFMCSVSTPGQVAKHEVLPKNFLMDAPSASAVQQLPSNSISHLTVDGSTIWIGSSKGLAKSTDGGRNWESFRSNSAFAREGVFAVATRGSLIWTSTGYEKEIGDGSVQTGAGYTFSTDVGTTWTGLPQTLDQRGDSIIAYGINDSIWLLPVVVPEQNVTFDISLDPNAVWIASWASGLRKSTDNGATWERILLPPDNRSQLRPFDTLWTYAANDSFHLRRIFPRFDPRSNNNFLAFSVLALDNGTVWCGTAGGVNKSTDGGVSWTRFTHQNQRRPILGNWVIAIDEQRIGARSRIWVTNWKTTDPDEEFGVSFTDDGGQTWKNLLHGVRAYDFSFQDSIVYISTDEGLYRTDDDGETFTVFKDIVSSTSRQTITQTSFYSSDLLGDTLFVASGDGLVSTVDNSSTTFGSSWNIYRAFEQVGSTAETYAYPNPFSPAFGPLRIHYGTSTNNADRTVSIDIFDFGMNRVRTLLHDAPRSGTLEFDELWDGTDDAGRVAANGVYFYRIKINDEEPRFGKILLLQ